MDLEKFFSGLLMFAVTIAIAAGLGCLFMTATASKKIDHCYIVYNNTSTIHEPVYVVIGHRSWSNDINVATAKSAEDAATKKVALCP